ncbi:SRPBCC family protein [Microbacterium sp. HJ5]
MPAEYSFVSRWHVPVPAERAWQEIERMLRPGAGPTWWPGVRLIEPPATLAPGERLRLGVRSPLGYRLEIGLTLDEVDIGRSIAASSRGDLRGRGRVTVTADGDAASAVVFDWDVVTERRWMNATAWVLRPAFERAHAHVMRSGERGLRREIERRGR